MRTRVGELTLAEREIATARTAYRRLGLSAALYEAAVVAMFQARHEAALARFDEGIEIARRAGARLTLGALTTSRGGVLQELGRLDEALRHPAEAARLFRELGSRYREMSAR